MKTRLALSLLFFSVVLLPAVTHAQWQFNGVGVSTLVGSQGPPVIVSDGAGGAIMAWQDRRSGIGYDIFAQRVNAFGMPLWATNGVVICNASGDQVSPAIESDGAGGAIVAWQDFRAGGTGVYAQRINAAGGVQWTPNGVALSTAAAVNFPAIVSDLAGGAIVTWVDFRSAGVRDIYARRINASGVPQGPANGVALCTAVNEQYNPRIVSDSAGGAIVTWEDLRTGSYDVYAQHLDATGVADWNVNGTAICTATGNQNTPTLTVDGSGGAIIVWADFRSGDFDIYAQRVDSAGDPTWVTNGVAVCVVASNQSLPTILSDGIGGAIVAWADLRGAAFDIYAQRIDRSGTPQWTGNGVALCTAANQQTTPAIASDNAGGAIVTWRDDRNSSSDIYAQRVNSSGTVQWNGDGVPLCTAANSQVLPVIAADGAGGAIISWDDSRALASDDVYAQRVEGTYGYWGHPEPLVTSVADIPNDQGGKVAVNWDASGRDLPSPATINFYSVWRAVDSAALVTNADEKSALASLDPITIDSAPGTRTMLAGSPYYWELVGTQIAYRLSHYSFSAATRADSVLGSAGDEFFMVMAHDVGDQHIAFMSNAAGGHSVDNLAPAAPLLLLAQRAGADVNLKWNGVHVPDLKDYAVYRATSSGVTPVPLNFLANSDDSILVDPGAPSSALYYIVTAIDVHANQSTPSNEASVSALTGVGTTPSITQLTVLANHPNPFSATTELEIGLPSASDIDVEIYDVAGRRVSEISVKQANSGWQRIPFTGRDSSGLALASGVYFYRVHAAGTTVTRKMVITR
jgi:FlgD Ig-like domain